LKLSNHYSTTINSKEMLEGKCGKDMGEAVVNKNRREENNRVRA